MSLSRFFLPLLIVSTLLFAQQVGITHTLRHTLTVHKQKHGQQTSHNSHNCEQCALDAELGSALHSAAVSFVLPQLRVVAWPHRHASFQQARILAASARGPPSPKKIA